MDLLKNYFTAKDTKKTLFCLDHPKDGAWSSRMCISSWGASVRIAIGIQVIVMAMVGVEEQDSQLIGVTSQLDIFRSRYATCIE